MEKRYTVSKTGMVPPRRTGTGRRVALVALSAVLAGAIFYRNVDGWIAGQPVWLAAALLYGTAIGLTAALVLRWLPRFGTFVELTALSRLVLAGISLPFPALAASMTSSPILNASLIVGGAAMLQVALGARAHRGPSLISRLRLARAVAREV